MFALIVGACTIAAVAAVVSGIHGNEKAEAISAGADDVLPAAQAARRPMILYRSPKHRGQVDIAALGAARGAATRTSLDCDRVYFAGGRGVCLARGGGLAPGEQAEIFDSHLRIVRTLGVDGIPSRVRVSPNGQYGSVTLFVAGHAYAAPGTFSTQTTLIDLADGRKIADLEQFTVFDGGHQVTAVDVNFWGVTFAADGDTFYATLATGGKTYLIRGSVSRRTARVLHDNVECPSLSPDGTRIAFKKRTGSTSKPWRLTVLDLATMHETPLAETRSVDDQAEWLDDGHVLYGLDGAIWTVPADGSGAPRRFVAGGDSPAVMRW